MTSAAVEPVERPRQVGRLTAADQPDRVGTGPAPTGTAATASHHLTIGIPPGHFSAAGPTDVEKGYSAQARTFSISSSGSSATGVMVSRVTPEAR